MLSGEDVGHYGGSYKVTSGLYKKYGEMRVMDTPICGEFAFFQHAPIDLTLVIVIRIENGFMGMGIGAAMTGLRPIIEGMNMGVSESNDHTKAK